ncbi:DEAD/DEAH box helicase [Leptolyngbya sp. AN03gr2]|uniref:DEAD/DEAH box helicase n=1 Tax=unclassified Leptolyngbya TaxID=2650499 RepID=UPI003D322A1F
MIVLSALPHQQTLLESGILEGKTNAIIQAPTGFGKTQCSQYAIQSQLEQRHRVIYLSATRALANELFESWQNTFTPHPVGIFTGDFSVKPPVSLDTARVMILTPERLDISLRFWKQQINWLSEVTLVIADEIHLIDRSNGRRGVCLEAAIYRFLRFNPFARVIGLSATLGNREELADWLQGVHYQSKHRPVPLTWEFGLFKKASHKPEVAIEFIDRSVKANEQIIVFVQSRRRAESLNKTIQHAGYRTAFHHAGLELDDRRRIESQFRTQQIDVLVATPTLELGVNLPCQTVILYDAQQWSQGQYKPLTTNTAWQRAGRAGRWTTGNQNQTPGKAVVICPQWNYQSERQYPKGQFEPIQSGLPNYLHEQILVEIASGFCFTVTQLRQAFSQSLAAHQHQPLAIEKIVEEMLEVGILYESNSDQSPKLNATALGHIANRHQLLPQTLKIIHQMIEKEPILELFDLLVVIARCPDFSLAISPDYEHLESFAEALQKEPSRLLDLPNADVETLLELKGKAVLTIFNIAHICRTWTHNGSKTTTATLCHCYPFEVGQIQEEMIRLLKALRDLIPVLEFPNEAHQRRLQQQVQILTQMVVTGLNEQNATLTLVKGLGPKAARTLVDAGVQDIEDLALTEPQTLTAIPGIGEKRAATWVVEAENWISQHYSAYSFQGEIPDRPTLKSVLPKEIDVYVFRRAYELNVEDHQSYYVVSGGEDKHRVYRSPISICDCGADSTQPCKHKVAVGLHLKDPVLTQALQYANTGKSASFDVYQLWWKTSLDWEVFR